MRDDRAAHAAHPDLETLADLDAGLLDPATADELAAHVAGCPHCRAATRALDQVRTDLAALPPPALPDTVAARLDATLADLGSSAGRHAPTDGNAPADRHTPTDQRTPRGPVPVSRLAERRRRRERLMRRATSVAAGLVALAIAGVVTTSVLRGENGSDTGSAGTASSTQGDERLEDPGGGKFGRESERQDDRSASAPGGLPAYDRDTLRVALPVLVREATTAAGIPAPAAGEEDDLAAAEDDAALRDRCAASVPGAPTGRPSAFRAIRFEGVPAFVLVYDENGQLSGYVVGTECGRVAQPSVLYRVPA
jgi:Putative zinc-finger